eukprot:2715702-Amphidinium_carterae.2
MRSWDLDWHIDRTMTLLELIQCVRRAIIVDNSEVTSIWVKNNPEINEVSAPTTLTTFITNIESSTLVFSEFPPLTL